MATFRKGGETFVGNTAAPRVPATLKVLALSGLQHAAALPHAAAPGRRARRGQPHAEELCSIYDQPPSVTGEGLGGDPRHGTTDS